MRFISVNALVTYITVRFDVFNLATKHSEITGKANIGHRDLLDTFYDL